jgi:hypothetical protein
VSRSKSDFSGKKIMKNGQKWFFDLKKHCQSKLQRISSVHVPVPQVTMVRNIIYFTLGLSFHI